MVHDLCFLLVEVRKAQVTPVAINNSNNRKTKFAEFTHLTARQYLQWVTEASPEKVPALLKPRRLQKLYRETAATWYFAESTSLKNKLDQLQDRPKSFELEVYLEMVTALWDCLKLESLRKDMDQDESRKANELRNARTPDSFRHHGKVPKMGRNVHCRRLWLEVAEANTKTQETATIIHSTLPYRMWITCVTPANELLLFLTVVLPFWKLLACLYRQL